MTEYQPSSNQDPSQLQPQQSIVPQPAPAPAYTAPQQPSAYAAPQPSAYAAPQSSAYAAPQQAPAPGYAYPAAPVYAAPVEVPPTGGSKVGYFALSFFLGLLGMAICYLIAKDKGPQHVKAAFMFSIIAQACAVVIGIFLSLFFDLALFAASYGSYGSYGGYYI